MTLMPSFELNMKERMNIWQLLDDSEAREGEFEPESVEFLREGETHVNGQMILERAKEMGGCSGQRHAEAMRLSSSRIITTHPKDVFLFVGTRWQDRNGIVWIPSMRLFEGLHVLFFHPFNFNFYRRDGYRLILARPK